MSQSASLEQMAKILNANEENIRISYGFFGSPYFAVGEGEAQTVYDLYDLAQKVHDFSIKPNKPTAKEYMLAGYLVYRVSCLCEMADGFIGQASCITQIFIYMRRCIVSVLACFFNIRDRHEICYLDTTVEIPMDLVSNDPRLLKETTALERHSKPGMARYPALTVDSIYPRAYILSE